MNTAFRLNSRHSGLSLTDLSTLVKLTPLIKILSVSDDVGYGWEKFYGALRGATRSSWSLQRRLESVVMGICHLRRDSFPSDESWERFDSFLKVTSKSDARNEHEGTIHATTSQMSDEDAVRLLETTFDIFNDLARSYPIPA